MTSSTVCVGKKQESWQGYGTNEESSSKRRMLSADLAASALSFEVKREARSTTFTAFSVPVQNDTVLLDTFLYIHGRLRIFYLVDS